MTNKNQLSNYKIALKAEMKKVIRVFMRYSKDERIAMAWTATRANGNEKKFGGWWGIPIRPSRNNR